MAVLWPRVGKIQIDPVNFFRCKNFRKFCGVFTQKMNIWKLQGIHFLDCAQQYTGVTFDADIIDFGM